MTLTQKKFLRPTFIFKIIDRKLKITSKTPFSKNSYEVNFSELSTSKVENSNFSIKWVIISLIPLVLTAFMIIVGIDEIIREGTYFAIFCAIFPLLFLIYTYQQFRLNTFSYVHLCREDNGAAVVTFYSDNPTEEGLDVFIKEIISLIEGKDRSGFSSAR